MTSLDEALDELAPGDAWSPSWDDVLARAGRRGHRSRGRTIVLALTVIAVVVVVPLVAVAAVSNDWWFLKHETKANTPTREPVVIKEGAFGGKQWQLVAYPAADGLCYSLTFTAAKANGGGSAAGCGSVVGFPSQHPNPQMTITYMGSGGSPSFPNWITGPVIPTAATVRIRIAARTITTPTFAAPSSLGRIRFYAVELPRNVNPFFQRKPKPGTRPPQPLHWVAGYDSHGQIVACLNPDKSTNGLSALSACR